MRPGGSIRRRASRRPPRPPDAQMAPGSPPEPMRIPFPKLVREGDVLERRVDWERRVSEVPGDLSGRYLDEVAEIDDLWGLISGHSISHVGCTPAHAYA